MACPRTANLRNFVGNFVGELCRNRPFSTELRQSVSTKIDDKVGDESFGTNSSQATTRAQNSRLRPTFVSRDKLACGRCLSTRPNNPAGPHCRLGRQWWRVFAGRPPGGTRSKPPPE